MSNDPFVAAGRVIRRRPTEAKHPDGGTVVGLGFPVCTLSEWVDDEAAATVAALLNAGHKVLNPDDAAHYVE